MDNIYEMVEAEHRATKLRAIEAVSRTLSEAPKTMAEAYEMAKRMVAANKTQEEMVQLVAVILGQQMQARRAVETLSDKPYMMSKM